MTTDFILGLLMLGAYLAVDFLIFKYFIHNKKGLIQILMSKLKPRKKIQL